MSRRVPVKDGITLFHNRVVVRWMNNLVSVMCVALITVTSALARPDVPRTKISVYSPFTITGALSSGIKVVRSFSGTCGLGSLASARSDAWRCDSNTGNAILDPCYSGALNWVACPVSLFGNRVVRLNLTKPLPRNRANKPLNTRTADPTQITLVSGVVCGFSTGATGAVAGLRLNYGCTNGAWLAGSPNRTVPVWTILYLRSLKSNALRPVSIVIAWY